MIIDCQRGQCVIIWQVGCADPRKSCIVACQLEHFFEQVGLSLTVAIFIFQNILRSVRLKSHNSIFKRDVTNVILYPIKDGLDLFDIGFLVGCQNGYPVFQFIRVVANFRAKYTVPSVKIFHWFKQHFSLPVLGKSFIHANQVRKTQGMVRRRRLAVKSGKIFDSKTNAGNIAVLHRSFLNLTAVLEIKFPQICFKPRGYIEFNHSFDNWQVLVKIKRRQIFYIAVVLFIFISKPFSFFFKRECHRAIFCVTVKNIFILIRSAKFLNNCFLSFWINGLHIVDRRFIIIK